jgi:hypothetical protein
MKPFLHSSSPERHRMVLAMLLFFLIFCLTGSASAIEPAYYELRIYTVTSNKMDAVLDRFRETVYKLRPADFSPLK